MNVARPTFVRRGYLLTALAVAVLLAGFSGTAWAQTTTVTAGSRFTPTSGTLQEGASITDLSKPRPLKVIIRRTTRTKNDPYNASLGPHLEIAFEYNDEDHSDSLSAEGSPFRVTASVPDGPDIVGFTIGNEGTANLTFPDSGETRVEEDAAGVDRDVDIAEEEIELTFEDTADTGNWLPEKLVLTLTKGSGLGGDEQTGERTDEERKQDAENPYVRDFTSKLTVTITDSDPQPVFNFDPTAIQLAKDNEQTVTVGVGVGAGGEGTLPTGIEGTLEGLLTPDEHDILLSVSPADAVGPMDDADRGLVSITDSAGMDLESDSQGRYHIGTIATAVTVGIPLTITAKEPSGFRDEMISLTLMDGRTEEQMVAEGGGVDAGAPATVTILSGEETPTVEFSTDSISIDEGDSETVHLLASGMQGDEVGSVSVAVRGDAMISLEQNGSPTSGLVSFGGNANAELTIVANSDPSLEDGEEKTATITITDASGAIVGDPGTVTVTVVGSTAVPVLPLFAQLLLALLLMVGGARLYRRRQG